MVIPGLTQTEDCIRALFTESGLIAEGRMESRVQTRLKRQSLLYEWECPSFAFLVHEHALRTVVGGPRVMRDQLMHLADLSKRGVCRIRIVPASTGGKASALGGSFMVLTHDDSATVNIELTTTSLFLDSPSDVATYGRSLAVLDTRALTERQSLGVLRTWASKYAERARTGRLASARTWSGEV